MNKKYKITAENLFDRPFDELTKDEKCDVMTAPRLFVDVDDTLLLYDSEGDIHHYGIWKDDAYHLNAPLVEYILSFRNIYPDALIVIWSGGGSAYAEQVKCALFPDLDIVTLIKDQTTFHLVRENDIVIDDQDIDVPVLVTKPTSKFLCHYE